MFTPQQLLSFVAVCETASFTRAAGRVHLSQSTVSQQVRRLEEMIGRALLVRTSHQVMLTEEGEKMLAYARRIIALNSEAWDVMGDTWRDGILRLGVPEDFAAPTADLLADFSRTHPQLRLDVMSGMYVDLHRAWQREELDIMLIKQPGGERPSPRVLSRCSGSTARLTPALPARRCRWWYFRSRDSTGRRCARRWTSWHAAGASATAAPAWQRSPAPAPPDWA